MAKPKAPQRPVPLAEQPDRGQIVGLTLLVAAAAVPLLSHLEWPIGAMVAGLIGLRLLALRWRAIEPPSWLLVLLTLAGGANCLNTYETLNGQLGGSALFITMLALKLLELNSRRDLRLAAILLGFMVVVQFLFDQSLALALYLALIVFGVVVLLADLNGALGPRRVRAALGVAGRLSLQALPLTLVLFVLFPRLSAPLWDLGLEETRNRVGLSDSLELGTISDLVVDGELAFRVRFEGEPPSPADSYWRAVVLWETDGRNWSIGEHPSAWNAAPELVESARVLEYEVLAEPNDRRWLFALDMPLGAPAEARLNADFLLQADEPLTSVRRYRTSSALDYRTPEPGPELRELALRLPPTVTPRMRDLVAEWRAMAGADDWALVGEALGFFNREGFAYTLLPPPLGPNPVDSFLFETRSGFCEHYASSFALLMRIAGIPSRVVLGYLGGEFNRVGNYHMIWNSDAHAWAEVFIAGRGWVRVDPTAAVDPARIDNRSASRLLGAGPSVRFELKESDGLARAIRSLHLFADSLDAAWQNWVLDFSVEDQLALLDRLGLGALREYGLAALMLAALALTLGLVLLALMREPVRSDALERRYLRLCRRLARAGLPRAPHEGPSDYGDRVMAARPELRPQIESFLALYVPARYGRTSPPDTPAQLDALLRRLR